MLTARTILEEKIPARLAQKPELARNVGAVLQLDLDGEGGGTWTIDLTRTSDWVREGAAPSPACTLRMSAEDFVRLYEGKVTGFELFTSQRLKVAGQIGLALKVNPILGG